MRVNVGKGQLVINGLLMIVMAAGAVYISYQVMNERQNLGTKAVQQSAILSLNTAEAVVAELDEFEVQVFLLPEGNRVGGVDAVLNYESTFLEVISVDKAPTSPFLTFESNIDSQNGRIVMTNLIYQNGQVGDWVTESTPLATVVFKALAVTDPVTVISFDYGSNLTNDSNVAAAYEGQVVDALEEQPNQLEITIGSAFAVGDINRDGSVDILDYGMLIQDFGLINDPDTLADLDGDDNVDIIDYGMLLGNFGL